MVFRSDVIALKATKNAHGFLRGDARVTRVGVFAYRNADGSSRRELRHPDDVFKAASLDSLADATITLGHPVARVDASNVKALGIGEIKSARRDGSFIVAPFVIRDGAAIAEIEAGTRELSCGYDCDLIDAPGVYDGEAYDVRQTNIAYNHVAVLSRGRAGPEVRIDGDDSYNVNRADNTAPEGSSMKIRIAGVDYEVPDQVAQAFTAHADGLTARADAATAKVDALTARADAADAEIVRLKAEHTPAKIAEKIAARVDLVTKATKVIGGEFKADALSDDEIKRAVIVKVTPTAKLEGKSADYVNARFDHALESFVADETDESEAEASKGNVRLALANKDASDGEDSESARLKMIERSRNAWRAKA